MASLYQDTHHIVSQPNLQSPGKPDCFASVGMGRTRRSNKLQSRAEVFPCPRKLGIASASRRRSPYFGSISSNTPRFRLCATSTAFTPRCSTVGRRSSSRTPLPHSSTAPAAPATTRTGGSPCWNKSCNASTKSSPNSWRIISDNGPQFIARDFNEFIRICGMTHVRTSPFYPQSNGKIERWFKTLKGGCIRVKTPLSLEDARRLVAEFVTYYNTVRLHSAIAYVTSAEKLAGRAEAIWAARREKLATANARRRAKTKEK